MKKGSPRPDIEGNKMGSAHYIYAMRRKNTAPGRKDGNLKDLVKVSFRLSEACLYLVVYTCLLVGFLDYYQLERSHKCNLVEIFRVMGK